MPFMISWTPALVAVLGSEVQGGFWGFENASHSTISLAQLAI